MGATAVGLPADTPFALNNRGTPDMGIFDFTKKQYRTEPCRIIGSGSVRPLLVTLVGDSLIAPFWPLGTGANKAVLGAMDSGHYLSLFKQACMKPTEAERDAEFLQVLAEGRRVLRSLKGCGTNLAAGGAQLLLDNKAACGDRNQRFGRPAAVAEYTWRSDPQSRYAKLEACDDVESVRDCLVQRSLGTHDSAAELGELGNEGAVESEFPEAIKV